LNKKLQIANPIVKERPEHRLIPIRVNTELFWASIATKVAETVVTANELLFIMGKMWQSFPHAPEACPVFLIRIIKRFSASILLPILLAGALLGTFDAHELAKVPKVLAHFQQQRLRQ